MKKQIFVLTFFTMLVLMLSACSDDENKNEVIPTSDFVLEAPYEWKKDKDVFYIINSSAEMYDCIESVDGSKVAANMPDFDKYTLLAGNVRTTTGISKIETRLIKHNDTNYTFEIHVFTNEAAVAENRVIAVTCPLLPANAKITSKTTIYKA